MDEIEDALARVSSLDHDGIGRTTLATGPDGRSTAFAFDENGNLETLTPPYRAAHGYVHDARNLETRYNPPLLGPLVWPTLREYNLDQDPTLTTLGDGREISLSYLSDGVLDRITTPDGDIEFGYDEVTGEVESITAPSGLVATYSRDGDLVTDVVYSGLFSASVHQEFDNNLRVIEEQVNGGSAITFDYDLDGIPTQVGALSLVPDPDNGRLTSTELGVVTDAFDYSGYGDLEGYAAEVSSTEVYSHLDERDELGRIFQSTEAHGSTPEVIEYDYDLAGRLEQVTRDSVVEQTYGYDANDNRISVTDLSGTRTATVDAQDRLLAFGDFEYTYNHAGQLETKTNISTDDLTTYTYDVQGNLLTVDILDGDRIDYAVDGMGHRVGRWVNSVLDQTYILSGARVAASIDSSMVLSRYVYATGGMAPDYLTRGGSSYRIIKDPRGSVHLVIDASTGDIEQRIDYGPFGEVVADSNPGFQPFGYAGGLYDPVTGLVRLGARDYDADAGRWTAKDPTGFQDTGNLYAYGSNDPINLVDTSGHNPALVVAMAQGAVEGAAWGAAIGVGVQALKHGFNFHCYDWGQVGKEALIGGAAGATLVGVGALATKSVGLLRALWGGRAGAGGGEAAAEVFFRTMSQSHADELVATGKLAATSETFISPTRAFAQRYDGVLVQFELKAGTTQQLASVGVRDGSALTAAQYPGMSRVSSGWASESAYFKAEGAQINVGLGRGAGLDTFNANITAFKVLP